MAGEGHGYGRCSPALLPCQCQSLRLHVVHTHAQMPAARIRFVFTFVSYHMTSLKGCDWRLAKWKTTQGWYGFKKFGTCWAVRRSPAHYETLLVESSGSLINRQWHVFGHTTLRTGWYGIYCGHTTNTTFKENWLCITVSLNYMFLTACVPISSVTGCVCVEEHWGCH